MSVRLYYPEPLEGVAVHPIFHYRHPPAKKGGGLFRDVRYSFFKEAETKEAESADAIVLVHNFSKEPDEKTRDYLRHFADSAEQLHKPLFIFSCGDFTDTLRFDPRIWVFRQSLYRNSMGPRDICMPTTTEDPPQELLFLREKQEKSIVSFCGMGGFGSVRGWIKYYAQNLFYDCAALLKPVLRARKLGVYWRRAMMRACERSSLVKTNFIVRHSFSGHAKSIELDPARARREYLETTANADFVLAPKGDGNYSNRFLKTLAFGRIPVLVDTDIVLPLEDEIEYSKIIVRVPMKQVAKTPRYIHDFYDSLSSEEWHGRQRLARETFERYLKQDAFFRHFFVETFSRGHV
ncbi:MAG: exostosin family protein [bacterium]|nr:exostosin family protein [bacterium]